VKHPVTPVAVASSSAPGSSEAAVARPTTSLIKSRSLGPECRPHDKAVGWHPRAIPTFHRLAAHCALKAAHFASRDHPFRPAIYCATFAMAVLIDHGCGLYADSCVFTIGLPTAKQRWGRRTHNHCGSPALRRPWQKRATSSARRNGVDLPVPRRAKIGIAFSCTFQACCAGSRPPASALLAAKLDCQQATRPASLHVSCASGSGGCPPVASHSARDPAVRRPCAPSRRPSACGRARGSNAHPG
jgi:hypothetical protein